MRSPRRGRREPWLWGANDGQANCNGEVWREPPYTKEEEAEFCARTAKGPVIVVKQAPGLHQKAQLTKREEEPRS